MVLGLRARTCQIHGDSWGPLAKAALRVGRAAASGLALAAAPASASEPAPVSVSAPAPVSAPVSVSASAPVSAPVSASAPVSGPRPRSEPTSSYATGREVVPPRLRPSFADVPLAACSFTEPACVHAPPGVSPWSVAATLQSAEGILRAHRALGLPLPLPDGDLGGSPAFDIYLLPDAAPPTTSIDLETLSGPFDRASAFAVLPPPAPRSSCVDQAALARAVAHASIMRLDAGAELAAVAMASSYIATLTAPCDLAAIAAVDTFQREPARGIASDDEPGDLAGSLLFPWYLDDAYGTGRPAAVILGLLAVSAQRTPPGSLLFHNEPDIFDALRSSLNFRRSTLDELLLDFAVARAFVGSRSDEAHLTDAARFGDLGRVRFEWSVPFSSLPRRLAPASPLEPTGATYLWLDLEGAPKGADLTFVADWELPAVFRWALVKVDRSGAEVGRVGVAGIFGSSHAERTVVGLDDLAGILIVGVSAGSMDRSHPFDPDEAPFMPHAYTVTLYK